MTSAIKIFVSYSHADSAYLADDSLLGFLKGLERDGVEFWDDRNIRPGELWDEVIKQQLKASRIALVLVSQAFLDSDYCQTVEIKRLLIHKAHLFPIILSACDWRRHDWLAQRQFMPTGNRTVEEHYKDSGDRKRFFLEIRQSLKEMAMTSGQGNHPRPTEALAMANPTPQSQTRFSGAAKVEFGRRLGPDWRKLATYLEIPSDDYAAFPKGQEGLEILAWLERHGRLYELPDALNSPVIKRGDLAALFMM